MNNPSFNRKILKINTLIALFGIFTSVVEAQTNQNLLDTLLKKPCISSDNCYAMFFKRESRGSGSGASEYNLVIKNALNDQIIFHKTLFSEEESDSLGLDYDSEIRVLRQRFESNASDINQYNWKPMLYMQLPEPEFFSDGCYSTQMKVERSVVIGKFTFIYKAPRLRILTGKKVILDKDYQNWQRKAEWCEKPNPSWLYSVAVSADQKVALVGIDFCGVEACSEPPADYHAVIITKK